MAEGGRSAASGVRDDVNVCHLCGALESLSLCGGCRGIWYCSKAHQREDWKDHKLTCKRKLNVDSQPVSEQAAAAPPSDSRPRLPEQSIPSDASPSDGYLDARPTSTKSRFITKADSTNPALSKFTEQSAHMENAVGTASVIKKGSKKYVHSKFVQQSSPPLGASERDSQPESNHNQSSNNKVKLSSRSRCTPRSKAEQGNITAEDGPPPERYYLDKSTHKISLPPSVGTTSGQAYAMGRNDDNLDALQSKEQYLLILRHRFKELASYVVECLTRYGICVIDKFLGEVTGQDILKEVLDIYSAGVMTQGQLVHGPSASGNKYIRGDMITWLDGREPHSENIHFLISCMDAVMLQCANQLKAYTINERTKAMIACYPGRETGYVRHVDNPNGDGRCVTCIYYLNKDWDVRKHGGLLRIYPEGEDKVANIEPIIDRIIFFWSDRRNPHEVEQAFKERYAITVWYYDANERAEALKRFKGNSESKRRAVPLMDTDQTLK